MKKIRLLCIGVAVAAALTSTASVQAGQNSLDVDSIINTAIENSYQIKSVDISIEKAQNSYKDQTRSGDGDGAFQTKSSITQYENIKESAKNQIKQTLYTQYVSFMNIKDALELEQKRFSNVEAQYNKAQLQLKMGLISSIEAKSSEKSYYDEKAQLNKAQRQFDLVNKTINQIIGVDLNTTYSGFNKDIIVEGPNIKTYDEYVRDALANRVEILNDNESIKVKKLQFDSVKGAHPYNNEPEYKLAQYSLEEVQNKLETDKIDISIEINDLYNTLQNKIKSLESEKVKYNSAKKDYNTALQKYNLGMMSKIDFDQQEISFKAEENTLKSIERDIALAKMKIEFASGKGTSTN